MSRNCLSPWLVDVSESSLPVARRRLPWVQLLVAVAVVDGTLCRWLSSTAIELSLMGFPDSLRYRFCFKLINFDNLSGI
ncbi:hypothetical protein HID58_021903 [Brassica napus]|uniref:Uncharacterized protein n=1 Tax=Brassica napus TaxID=3708 RepID=A0ABQ8CXP4_BRANA|nr:hypothetical protein HID58_021903 [Brassica napus]